MYTALLTLNWENNYPSRVTVTFKLAAAFHSLTFKQCEIYMQSLINESA